MSTCKHCKTKVEREWSELHADGPDTFARLVCPHCEKGCYLIADIGGQEREYRCCYCQK